MMITNSLIKNLILSIIAFLFCSNICLTGCDGQGCPSCFCDAKLAVNKFEPAYLGLVVAKDFQKINDQFSPVVFLFQQKLVNVALDESPRLAVSWFIKNLCVLIHAPPA